MEIETIRSENCFREFLSKRGFAVNSKKKDNETGYDIVAVKDGYSFLIEFKSIEHREDGTFRFSGDIKGEVLVIAIPNGLFTFWNDGNMSLTKTCRLLSMLEADKTI